MIEPFTRDSIETKAEELGIQVSYDNINQNIIDEETNQTRDKRCYIGETKTIDFKQMRVTNFKTNGRIYAPKVGKREEEIII